MLSNEPKGSGKPNYGIDAPGVVRNFGIIALVCALVAFLPLSGGPFVVALQSIAFWVFLWCAATAIVMLGGSLFLKLRLRDYVLNSLNLRGDERLLDVGCGSSTSRSWVRQESRRLAPDRTSCS